MKSIFLSIIIPSYNSEKTIVALLDSIRKSKKVHFHEIELIIVDDHSSDRSLEIILTYLQSSFASLKHCCIIALKQNAGPAHARNVGAKYAQGRILLFLDSDVEIYINTLYEVVNSFRNDLDLFALTGVWDKEQRSHSFFPKFKALRDWSYWINERDPKNYYYLFSTRIAAINRALFLRLGGFDETYKAALVEDIDLTYRIARRYAVVFNPAVMVHHEFETFLPIAQKYFWRSYYWSRMYRERKKFDPVATTWKEAVTTISAGLFAGGILISYLSDLGYLGNLERMSRWMWMATGILGLIHLAGVRKFLWFCFKEQGIWFMVRAFVTGILLYTIILAGAIWSLLKRD